MTIRKPPSDAETLQARMIWNTLIKHPRTCNTIYDLTLSLCVSQRYVRRLLAILSHYHLVMWSEPRQVTGNWDLAHRRTYEARRDPHAQRGYRRLFGVDMDLADRR